MTLQRYENNSFFVYYSIKKDHLLPPAFEKTIPTLPTEIHSHGPLAPIYLAR